jgi:hypothetical protein
MLSLLKRLNSGDYWLVMNSQDIADLVKYDWIKDWVITIRPVAGDERLIPRELIDRSKLALFVSTATLDGSAG